MALAEVDVRPALTRRGFRVLALTALLTGFAGCGGEDAADASGAPASAQQSNRSPSISGSAPALVRVGEPYSFQPAASDPDGDRLTFTATNLPSWATLAPATGRITGTPRAGEEGVYAGITLTVSDGHSSSTLAAFSVTVTQDAAGSALLSWLPPTTNADGTPLTDLAGYRIVYGRNASDLDQSIAITNPSINSYVVERLSAGTWHFGVIALNAGSIESLPSNLGSKTIS